MTARNLVKDRLLSPSNILRGWGMMTGRPIVGPLKVTLDITSVCDMGCVMCWYHSPLVSRPPAAFHMSRETFKQLASDLRKLKTRTICFTGEGDPLLHPHLKEMVGIAKGHGLGVEIMTNGRYVDKETALFFKKIKVNKMLVSLHCADGQCFKSVRPLRPESDFSAIIQNITFLCSLSCSQVFITNVLSSLNCHQVREMVALAEKMRANKILFKPLTLTPDMQLFRINQQQKRMLILELRRIANTIRIPNNITDYLRVLQRPGMKQALHGSGPLGSDSNGIRTRHIQRQRCYMPWISTAINISGDVFGCVYAKKCPAGNIYQSSIVDIWFGEKYRDFRRGTYCPPICLGKAVYPLL